MAPKLSRPCKKITSIAQTTSATTKQPLRPLLLRDSPLKDIPGDSNVVGGDVLTGRPLQPRLYAQALCQKDAPCKSSRGGGGALWWL